MIKVEGIYESPNTCSVTRIHTSVHTYILFNDCMKKFRAVNKLFTVNAKNRSPCIICKIVPVIVELV